MTWNPRLQCKYNPDLVRKAFHIFAIPRSVGNGAFFIHFSLLFSSKALASNAGKIESEFGQLVSKATMTLESGGENERFGLEHGRS